MLKLKNKEYKFKVIGIREGEKISESLMSTEEAAYMTELDDMFVLRDSLLSHYGAKEPIEKNQNVHIKDYDSISVPLLSKEEIKKVLIEKKIL